MGESKFISGFRGGATLLLMTINTILLVAPIYFLTFLKVALPVQRWRQWISHWLVVLAEAWITVNSTILYLTQRIDWQIEGLENLSPSSSYVVICNHQSWMDILVLQKTLNRQIPFLRFFIKKELLWVPFLGPAWWALDFPFMKRHSSEYLKNHPEQQGKDLEAALVACNKLKGTPTAMLNFLEGTRLTPRKHSGQNSPYRHLLKPKYGGLSATIQGLGRQLNSLIDVTIIYPDRNLKLWAMVSGKISRVIVKIRQVEIPAEIFSCVGRNDETARIKFRQWVDGIWQSKDLLLEGRGQEIPSAHPQDLSTT